MQIRSKRLLIGAVLAIVIVAAGIAWKRDPAAPALESTTIRPAPLQAASPARSLAPQVPAIQPIPASIANSDESLSVQVEKLLATQDPGSAYAAYFLVTACTRFNRHLDMKLFDPKLQAERDVNASERQSLTKMCSGMTERDRMARLDYLAMAVKGKVAGATWTFAAEGPLGDPSALKTRPDDPLVQEWKKTATTQLSQAAETGDMTALLIWGLQLLHGSDLTEKNPLLGYSYLLAFGFIQSNRLGPNNSEAQTYRDGSPMMNALAGNLTMEQRAAAVTMGRSIADKLKRQG
jgi:hypothetical protein